MSTVLRPLSFAEAVSMLAGLGPGAVVVAGATDLLVKIRKGRPPPETIVDLSRVTDDGARSIAIDADGTLVRAGALVDFSTLAASRLVADTLPALQQAASIMGSLQIRSRGTLAGNVANASPGGDALPPLIVGLARAILLSPEGIREVPVEGLFVGPGRTSLRQHEIIVALSWPVIPRRKSAFERVGDRAWHVITKASAAVAVNFDDDGRVTAARVALGAVAPVPMRARLTEELLEGSFLTEETLVAAGGRAASEARAIDDLRSTAAYRREICRVLVPRLLARLQTGWRADCGIFS
jgi:CO/xanthine dehydrogenase FAD-binding subunit